MTDHHDFGHHDDFDPGHDDFSHHEDPLTPYEQPAVYDDSHDLPWDDHDHAPPPETADAHVPEAEAVPPPTLDLPDVPDLAEDPVDVFPPPIDVGELPEPVDGFPWIDTATLGVADPDDTPGTPDPEGLAEYAAADLPPGADPWTVLADSDDPATSALARWWSPN